MNHFLLCYLRKKSHNSRGGKGYTLDAKALPFVPLTKIINEDSPYAVNVSTPNISMDSETAHISAISLNPGTSSLYWPQNETTGLSDTRMDGQDINDPKSILCNLKEKNIDRPVIGQLNINFIAPKFEPLVNLIKDNIDLLMVSETKVDNSYPSEQFKIEGYSKPIRLDRNCHGGGLMIFPREDLPCHELKSHELPLDIECTFLVM